jgi:Activator of Hsp90 ATPase homolog 1-like protein
MSTADMAQGRSADRIIHAHARLRLSARKAFEMFTLNAALQSWLVPLAEVSPTVGGKYELFWEPDDREHNSTLGCRITALDEGRFLSFEWKGPRQFEQFMNDADPLTHVLVFFIPGGVGAGEWTDAHLIHSGWRSTAEWEQARRWFEQSWRTAFTELSRQVNG